MVLDPGCERGRPLRGRIAGAWRLLANSSETLAVAPGPLERDSVNALERELSRGAAIEMERMN
jgi:hypothetical protein